MKSGELELKKAFEDVTTNNVRAAIEYSNETRKLVRVLEKKVESLDGSIRQYQEQIDFLKKQLTNIQIKVYSGGTQ
jgi:chaperonin cofactor prefoldin